MRYIRQRMKDKSRTDIELTLLKAEIEAIFSERNIDEDGDTITSLLSPYRKLLSSSLSQGYYADAEPSCSKCSKALLTTLWKMSIMTTSMICTVRTMFAKT